MLAARGVLAVLCVVCARAAPTDPRTHGQGAHASGRHIQEQVAHVSQALLLGARRFAAALSNVSVVRSLRLERWPPACSTASERIPFARVVQPSMLPDPIDPAVAARERSLMVAWWCTKQIPLLPPPASEQSHVCRRFAVAQKLRKSETGQGPTADSPSDALAADITKVQWPHAPLFCRRPR